MRIRQSHWLPPQDMTSQYFVLCAIQVPIRGTGSTQQWRLGSAIAWVPAPRGRSPICHRPWTVCGGVCSLNSMGAIADEAHSLEVSDSSWEGSLSPKPLIVMMKARCEMTARCAGNASSAAAINDHRPSDGKSWELLARTAFQDWS